jgi:hypothetical protein
MKDVNEECGDLFAHFHRRTFGKVVFVCPKVTLAALIGVFSG